MHWQLLGELPVRVTWPTSSWLDWKSGSQELVNECVWNAKRECQERWMKTKWKSSTEDINVIDSRAGRDSNRICQDIQQLLTPYAMRRSARVPLQPLGKVGRALSSIFGVKPLLRLTRSESLAATFQWLDLTRISGRSKIARRSCARGLDIRRWQQRR